MKTVINWLIKWIVQNKLITAILLMAAILRFVGVYPSYPPTHPDETYIYGAAVKMVRNLNIDPTRYDYPAFIPLVNAILYMVVFNPIFIVYSFFVNPDNLPNFKNILFFYQSTIWFNQQTAVIFWGRAITAAFGLGTVLLVFQVGKKFFNPSIGLAAAFLTAFNFRQVLNSHIGLPDIYNAFFLVLSFYFFSNLLKKPTRKNYLLSGLSVALFLSTKSQVFPILTFGLVHLLVVWKTANKQNAMLIIRRLFRIDFIIASLIIPIFYLIINIYQFIHWEDFVNINHYTTLQYKFGVKSFDFYPVSYLYHTGIGKLVSIALLLGAIWGLKKYTLHTSIFLSVLLPFLYLFLYYSNGGFYTRNFVTIIPILLIFAGLFIVEVGNFISKKIRLGKYLTSALIVLLLFVISFEPIKNSILNTYFYSKPWGLRNAKDWAEKNIPNGSIIAARASDEYPRKKQYKRVNFESGNVFSLAEMQEEGVEYGYVGVDELTVHFYWWMRGSTRESLSFWDKSFPDSISANTFPGIVGKELASWSVASFVKSWQAPDQNYLIVKVPSKMDIGEATVINQFSFDKEDELYKWFLISGYNFTEEKIYIDKTEGYSKKGSVRFRQARSSPSVTRAVSSIIKINNSSVENKSRAYEITAWMKNRDAIKKEDRGGFLRVDFYREDPNEIRLTTQSLDTAVSSRLYGTENWVEKKVVVIPPKEAKFMTVSVDIYNYGITETWFDDVTIKESKQFFDDPRAAEPYLNYYKIPNDVLFPLSHGNL